MHVSTQFEVKVAACTQNPYLVYSQLLLSQIVCAHNKHDIVDDVYEITHLNFGLKFQLLNFRLLL